MDEEAIDVDHLLVEPQVFRTLDDDDMCFSSKKVDKSFNVSGILCTTLYYDQEDEPGILYADYEQIGEQASKYEFVDSILQGAEDENRHVASSFLCDHSDYILGSDHAENSLMDSSCNDDTSVENVVSASYIQHKEDNKIIPSWLCNVKSPVVCIADQPHLSLDSMDNCEVSEIFRSSADRYTLIEDNKGLKNQLVFDQPNVTLLDNISNLMKSRLLSSENEDNLVLIPGNEMSKRDNGSLIELSHTGAKDKCPNMFGEAAFIELDLQTSKNSRKAIDADRNTKRLRKPTQRYIEETSELKSRYANARSKSPLVSSKDKLLHAREERKYQKGAMQVLYQDPDSVHSPDVCQKNKAKEFTFEVQVKTSKEYPATIMNRRKHHKQWTTSEIVKLVDGVSCYGVGRWTEIKRLLFSSSTYRTAVDLKDKWRNLLKSCIVYSENRNLIETQKKNAPSPIPQWIMRRVRELSVIHPYPRNQNFRNLASRGAPGGADQDEASARVSGRALRTQRSRAQWSKMV